MHDFVNALITAAAGLFGVGLGGVITLFNQRRQRADERLQQQLSEFYAPLLGLRMRILAKSETRVKSSGVLQTAWSEVLAGPRAIGDPELLKKTADEKWLAFQEAHDYSNRELREEIVPLYRKMVDIFTEKMWLAEPSTLIHFGVLVEYVEIWNRALAGAIPNDAMILYNHDEDKVKPLYADLASHVQRLSGGLQRTKTTRALDLKRGLNRLYLVFAVIWILGGFLYAYRTEKAAQQVACASLTSQGVTRLPSTVNPPQQPPDGVRVQGPDGQMYLFPTGTTKQDAISYFRQQREAQQNCETVRPVRTALLVAFGPAILGYGLLEALLFSATWVWRGFRIQGNEKH